MIRNIKRTWFEVWGEAQAQNQILKGLVAFFLVTLSIQSAALVVLALRKPILIAVTEEKSQVLSVTPPGEKLLELEIRRAVSGYVKSHYNWDYAQVDAAFQQAAHYVAPEFYKKFIEANSQQIKIAKEKKVSQRFYFSEPVVVIASKHVKVDGNRILLVEGLRAASPLTIDVEFDYGARSALNPEGIYVTGEKLIAQTP